MPIFKTQKLKKVYFAKSKRPNEFSQILELKRYIFKIQRPTQVLIKTLKLKRLFFSFFIKMMLKNITIKKR